jgi:hypothetical protein
MFLRSLAPGIEQDMPESEIARRTPDRRGIKATASMVENHAKSLYTAYGPRCQPFEDNSRKLRLLIEKHLSSFLRSAPSGESAERVSAFGRQLIVLIEVILDQSSGCRSIRRLRITQLGERVQTSPHGRAAETRCLA